MKPVITVGVISRNGMPFLEKCFESLEKLKERSIDAEFIFVDSNSTDGTCERMLAFAKTHDNAKVFRIAGDINAAIARNVILKNTSPGSLLLLDGDIELNADFLIKAIAVIEEGRADVVTGGLAEIFYNAQNEKTGGQKDRFGASKEKNVALIGGTLLLSKEALASGVLNNERLDRHHDWDFSLKLHRSFRLLIIPVSMGIHHTLPYMADARVGVYLSELYPKWDGILLRMNFFSPINMAHIIWRGSGPYFGFLLQLGVILGILFGWWWVALLVIAADAVRFIWQGRGSQYLIARMITPWIIIYGMITGVKEKGVYSVERCIRLKTRVLFNLGCK